MLGQVSSSYGSLSGTGTDQHYVMLDQTTCFLLSLFRTGVACCLPTCAQGLSVPVMGEFWEWHVFGFLASLLCLVCLGSASFAGPPFAHKTWVTLVCLLLDTSFWRSSVGALPL